MKVDIIIVNWNAGKKLSDCLHSIASFAKEQIDSVVVVDNGSSDSSTDDLDAFDLPLKVIRNRENLGFARACNQGASIGKAPYLLFLNPDASLYELSLSAPLNFMENPKNKDVGICSVQLLDADGKVTRTCARFPTLFRLCMAAAGLNAFPGLRSSGMAMREWDHSSDRAVDQVMGAFFLTRRCLFESLGGFDERFFMYFEDVDFSYLSSRSGWKSVYLASAQAFHLGGGTSSRIKATRLFYFLRSRLLYGFKHFHLWQAWSMVGVTFLIEPAARLGLCLMHGKWTGIIDTLNCYKMLLTALPEIINSSRGAAS